MEVFKTPLYIDSTNDGADKSMTSISDVLALVTRVGELMIFVKLSSVMKS